MSLGDRLGLAGLLVALVAVAAFYLWPEKKWIGWLALLLAGGLLLGWLVLEIKQRRSAQGTSALAAPLELRAEVIGKYARGTRVGGIIWTPGFNDLRVAIENPSDLDYQDMDITMRPNFPHVYISAIGQISNVPGVTFLDTGLQAWQGKAGPPSVKFDSSTGHTVGDAWKFSGHDSSGPPGHGTITPLHPIPNHYRMRCEKLPHRRTLEITLAIADEDMPKPEGRITTVWVKGEYHDGQGRVHYVDTVTSVP